MTAITLTEFPAAYQAALRSYCGGPAAAGNGMRAAQVVGTQALRLGLGTLDLAATHRQALSILESLGGTPLEFAARTKLARDFFAAALLPIEATHRSVLDACSKLDRLKVELARRSGELDHSAQALEQGTVARKAVEQALKNSRELSAKLQKESRQLCSRGREVNRGVLSANEDKRRALGARLQDEIAQALLGAHVRLLALESEATANSENFGEKVDLTRGLIQKTVTAIKGLLREFDPPHES